MEKMIYLNNYFITRLTTLTDYYFEFFNLSYPKVLLTLYSYAKNHTQNTALPE